MITPTQMIRQAALNTKEITVPSGKVVEYEEIEYDEVDDEYCYLCGGKTEGYGRERKKTIRPTFTDQSWARRPDSQSVCRGCVYCLGRREMRNYSIVATEKTLWHPSQADMRDFLLAPPADPYVFCVAESGQKWVHFRSHINYSKEQIIVAYEENRVIIDRQQAHDLFDVIEPLLNTFTKTEVLTGEYNQRRVIDYGLAEWRKAEKHIAPHRGSLTLQLIVKMAQKREVKKKEEPTQEKEIVQHESIEKGQLSLF